MKKVLFVLVIFFHSDIFGMTKTGCPELDSITITTAIRHFNDTLKAAKLIDGKYEVYVMHFYYDEKEGVNLLLSYIVNSHEFKALNSKYYFWVDSVPVLINNRDSSFINQITGLTIRNANEVFFDEQLIKIVQRLIPNVAGYSVTGDPSIFKVSLNNCEIKEQFYKFGTDFLERESVIPPENRRIDLYYKTDD